MRPTQEKPRYEEGHSDPNILLLPQDWPQIVKHFKNTAARREKRYMQVKHDLAKVRAGIVDEKNIERMRRTISHLKSVESTLWHVLSMAGLKELGRLAITSPEAIDVAKCRHETPIRFWGWSTWSCKDCGTDMTEALQRRSLARKSNG